MNTQRRCIPIIAAVLSGLLTAGCGKAVYEQRLENTKRYYAHLGELNANLTAEWKGPGISIRPPLGFVLIPAPQATDSAPAGEGAPQPPAGGNADQPLLDERQPNYINLDLPGLVAAWKWESVNAEGEVRSQQTSYMYLLSNQEIGTNPERRDDALRFHDRTLSELANALEAKLPGKIDEETYPPPAKNALPYPADSKKKEFVPSVTFRIISLDTDVSNDKVKRNFACHLFTQGEVQVIVLFVYSDVAEYQDLLLKRVPFCLETLSVSGDKVGVPATTITGPGGSKNGGF